MLGHILYPGLQNPQLQPPEQPLTPALASQGGGSAPVKQEVGILSTCDFLLTPPSFSFPPEPLKRPAQRLKAGKWQRWNSTQVCLQRWAVLRGKQNQSPWESRLHQVLGCVSRARPLTSKRTWILFSGGCLGSQDDKGSEKPLLGLALAGTVGP